jgi:hypothetical protein
MSSADDQSAHVQICVPESAPNPECPRDEGEAMLYCPVCNQRLSARHCKLVCERCGYYMSCADYY